MNVSRFIAFAIVSAAIHMPQVRASERIYSESLEPEPLMTVKIDDAFWSPKLQQWASKTSNDILNKFEGRHLTDCRPEERRNTLDNFRNVAKGDRDTRNHVHLPWFDGLIYESIRVFQT